MLILDTDVVSNLRRRQPNPALLQWIERVGWAELAITVTTVMEITFGIEEVRRTNPGTADAVEQWLLGILGVGEPQVLPLDVEAARIKGIKSEVAGRAQILLVPDLEAGNMLAKNLAYFAKADSAGIVIGARVPVVLTSRADSARARMASCAVAALYAHARRQHAPTVAA